MTRAIATSTRARRPRVGGLRSIVLAIAALPMTTGVVAAAGSQAAATPMATPRPAAGSPGARTVPPRARAHTQRDRLTPSHGVAKGAISAPSAPLPTGIWQPLGPAAVGPVGATANSGRVTAVATIPSGAHTGEMVVGSAGGGVWTSTDSGATWTPRTDAQPNLAIGAIAVDPTNPDHLIAGTGEGNQSGDSLYGAGLLVSTDAGQSWARQDPSQIFDGLHIAQIAIDPTYPLREFVGTDLGLFETADGGATWAKPSSPSYGNVDGNVTSVIVSPDGTVHVASAGALWTVAISTDHGAGFVEADAGMVAPSGQPLIALAESLSSPPTMDASVGGDVPVALYRSANGGCQLGSAAEYTRLHGSGLRLRQRHG